MILIDEERASEWSKSENTDDEMMKYIMKQMELLIAWQFQLFRGLGAAYVLHGLVAQGVASMEYSYGRQYNTRKMMSKSDCLLSNQNLYFTVDVLSATRSS